jgi:hypothetical protein
MVPVLSSSSAFLLCIPPTLNWLYYLLPEIQKSQLPANLEVFPLVKAISLSPICLYSISTFKAQLKSLCNQEVYPDNTGPRLSFAPM